MYVFRRFAAVEHASNFPGETCLAREQQPYATLFYTFCRINVTIKRNAPTVARLRQSSQRSTSCRRRQDSLHKAGAAYEACWREMKLQVLIIRSSLLTAYPCTRTFANKQLNKALDLGSQAAGFPQAPTAGTPQHHLQGDQASVVCWARK